MEADSSRRVDFFAIEPRGMACFLGVPPIHGLGMGQNASGLSAHQRGMGGKVGDTCCEGQIYLKPL